MEISGRHFFPLVNERTSDQIEGFPVTMNALMLLDGESNSLVHPFSSFMPGLMNDCRETVR